MTVPPTPASRAATLRTLIMALISAPLFILVAIVFVLGGLADATLPPLWMIVGLLLLVAGAFGIARTMEGQLTPVPLGTDREQAMSQSFQAFQANLFLRLAILEAPLFIGIVVSFVVDHGPWPALIAGVPTLLALAVALWPTPSAISRAEQRFDRAGGRSYFSEGW
ncbi:hypothetical protein D9V41_04355 [Aeromicrobium phragmitis]|uniref:Uncharacterized protein n=1 Tax=Aeromicrobium phragmitis TaxID=2478914 RepID=A0A3L8PNK6_9ACTN|nr:hypothetical protein [Aeromicrobium phragmitis]RLV56997.1 hypothetical protein D9V41_04355 [Aeromicrobium phragmitis]